MIGSGSDGNAMRDAREKRCKKLSPRTLHSILRKTEIVEEEMQVSKQ